MESINNKVKAEINELQDWKRRNKFLKFDKHHIRNKKQQSRKKN